MTWVIFVTPVSSGNVTDVQRGLPMILRGRNRVTDDGRRACATLGQRWIV